MIGAIFTTFRFTQEYAMVVYSPIMSSRLELKVVSAKDTQAKTQTNSLFNGALQGHVVRLGCSEAGGSFISCWIQTSENLVYLTSFKVVVGAGGALTISNIIKNKYTVGPDQFVTGCSVSKLFMVCTTDNLQVSDPKKKTSLLVFRAYKDSNDETFYSFADLSGDVISEIPPYISSISFEASRRLRRRMLLQKLGNSTADTTTNSPQKSYLFGANQKTIRKYGLQFNPALIRVFEDGLNKDKDFKNIGVQIEGIKPGSNSSTLTIGDLKNNTTPPKPKPKPVDPVKPIPKTAKNRRIVGWIVILLLIAIISLVIWFCMRREKMKNQKREDLMYDVNEMERYD